jgi:hypothetical protein
MHDGMEQIKDAAFYGCRSLKDLILNDNIFNIAGSAFEGCINLRSITIPSKISRIAYKAFAHCESLSEITLSTNVNYIEEKAFYGCIGLHTARIDAKYISIHPTAFIGCSSLTWLYLTNLHPRIALTSFADCANLRFVMSHSGEEDWQEINPSMLQHELDTELKYMSLYYRLLGMNITQMKWSESLKNEKSFKEPIDANWCNFKTQPQSLEYISSMDWSNSAGIGLVLGYNDYRALDIDINIDFFKYYRHMNGIDGFINEMLQILGLPSNYPWAVRSGNGLGFHIIFRCNNNEATEIIDSISFAPNDHYSQFGTEFFSRIELRWCDHLVLPPSLHLSSLQYHFKENQLPTQPPTYINLQKIEGLLTKYCGERIVMPVTYNNTKIYLTKIERIISRHDSYLTPHVHKLESIQWLENTKYEEDLNNLALCYLFGEGVDVDEDKAMEILLHSETQSATFNLLNLYTTRRFACSDELFHKKFECLDKNVFKKYIQQMNLNYNVNKIIPPPLKNDITNDDLPF